MGGSEGFVAYVPVVNIPGRSAGASRCRNARMVVRSSSAVEQRRGSSSGSGVGEALLHVRTPLVRSEEISAIAGRDVLLKLENVQPSGSFKIRGIGWLCAKAKSRGTKRFVSSSGGNAGAAVAYAGKVLGTPVVVCVPITTPEFMRARLERLGAEVIVQGSIWMEADALARSMCEDPDSTYVSPFDHEDIWEGHSTLVTEIMEDLDGSRPSAVVASVGGGGLLMGVCTGLQKLGWTDVDVIAVETEGAASFHAAIQEGHPVTLPKIDTVAKSLGASCVSDSLLPWTKRLPIRSQVVSDQQAVSACGQFAVDHRSIVEPACGATLAVGYDNLLGNLRSDGPVVLVVCGGNIATPAMLAAWTSSAAADWRDVL